MIGKVKKVKPVDAELNEKLVSLKRVAKVVKGGRRFSFSALIIVGDGNGVVGIGLGKAGEATAAITKGREDAKKNLVKVPILDGTVPHEVITKFGASKIIIRPAAPGTGVLAGGAMRAVLECAGIKNVLGKSHGSSNPQNVVKATLRALIAMRDPVTVATMRGIPLSKLFKG